MTKKKTNQLGLRSKEILTEAFFDLLKENPQNRIHIKDLCEHARISRPTFYAHYGTIEDILREFLDECLERVINEAQLILEMEMPLERKLLEINTYHFQFWKERIDCYKLIQTAGMESLLVEHYKKIGEYKYQNIGRKISEIEDMEVVDFFTSFLAHSHFLMMNLWINSGMKRSPKEMAEMIMLFIPPDLLNPLSVRFNH